MKKKLIDTADGSHTVRMEDDQETYHSVNGAWTESMHVFIEHGFRYLPSIINPVKILEVGFGTGLNAFMTWLEVRNSLRKVHYIGIEPAPVPKSVWAILNYPDFADCEEAYPAFRDIHLASWGTPVFFGENFILNKLEERLENVELQNASFDLVYFDAFSFDVNPDLWTEAIFRKIHGAMRNGGVLVTYSSKGDVRRAMIAAGFKVERIPGPPGKREMMRASR